MVIITRTRGLRPYLGIRAERRNVSSIGALKRAQERWGNKLVMSPEIEHAISSGDSIPVALESAIITHGMPYPYSLTTTQSLISIIDSHPSRRVLSAPIAILDSKIHVGLTSAQLERLANPPPSSPLAVKISRRDLPFALSRTGSERVNGGTTVAGTMIIARSLGIDLFVTGGIGGVHRGGDRSMDISADLQELSRTPMGVICAGAKSILDIGLTLEVLETLGVNVTTIGETDDFPAFYSPKSGFKSPYGVRDAASAATLLNTSLTLPSPISTLFAVPIPHEHHAAGADIQRAVERAVAESEQNGIAKRGKEVTPWLLKRVGELTKGRALQSNIALIENNARVGADLASKLWQLRKGTVSEASDVTPVYSGVTLSSPNASRRSPADSPPPIDAALSLPPPKIIIFGSAAIDITAKAIGSSSAKSMMGSTAPGVVALSPGGVGRNIAEATTRLLSQDEVMLVSVVGSSGGIEATTARADAWGTLLRDDMAMKGMRVDGIVVRRGIEQDEARTAVCNLTLSDTADLAAGVADMGIVETLSGAEAVDVIRRYHAAVIVLDGNLSPDAIAAVVEHQRTQPSGITIFEPTSIAKVGRIVPSMAKVSPATGQSIVTHFTPNIVELAELHKQAVAADLVKASAHQASSNAIDGISAQASALLPWFRNIWVKMGERGVLRFSADTNKGKANPGESYSYKTWTVPTGLSSGAAVRAEHYNAAYIDPSDVISTTGAGDSFVGGLVAALAVRGSKALQRDDVSMALECAAASLLSSQAISPELGGVRRRWRA